MSELAENGKPIESVWDFPRPPAIERVEWRISVRHQGDVIVDAPWAYRILETSQPPAYYVSPDFVSFDHLRPSAHSTYCEWKGPASYADVVTVQGTTANAAWSYPSPSSAYAAAAGFWAFYAQALDECRVDDEVVVSNPGSFYGGWLTMNVVGPVKGAPGTLHW